eukprot:13724146-Alexandrium_andersonii.AAC.1
MPANELTKLEADGGVPEGRLCMMQRVGKVLLRSQYRMEQRKLSPLDSLDERRPLAKASADRAVRANPA